MKKFTVLLLIPLVLASGCEIVCIVPSVDGRIVDAHSGIPVSRAVVTRICSEAPAKTLTGVDGRFKMSGKRRLQPAIGDTLVTPQSYLIEAIGYQPITTNRFQLGWASPEMLNEHLGDIPLVPK
jgi:hypothetical protein